VRRGERKTRRQNQDERRKAKEKSRKREGLTEPDDFNLAKSAFGFRLSFFVFARLAAGGYPPKGLMKNRINVTSST
jgi:hypothetical protein